MKKNLTQPAAAAAPTQADISQRAALLWENYGRPEGRDQEIWLEAERQLLGVDASVEGRDQTSMVAISFDEATSGGKPRTRLGKSPSAGERKPAGTPARSRR